MVQNSNYSCTNLTTILLFSKGQGIIKIVKWRRRRGSGQCWWKKNSFMHPFKPPKCFPREKLRSLSKDLIPDSDIMFTVLEQRTCCLYSCLVTPFTLTSAKTRLWNNFLWHYFWEAYFPFFSFRTLVLGNFSKTMFPNVTVDLVDIRCLSQCPFSPILPAGPS